MPQVFLWCFSVFECFWQTLFENNRIEKDDFSCLLWKWKPVWRPHQPYTGARTLSYLPPVFICCKMKTQMAMTVTLTALQGRRKGASVENDRECQSHWVAHSFLHSPKFLHKLFLLKCSLNIHTLNRRYTFLLPVILIIVKAKARVQIKEKQH